MAFLNTTTDIIELANGLIQEYGTFSGAGVTTGTIAANTYAVSYTADSVITDIIQWGFASDADNAVIPAKDVAPEKIKITFTSAATGDYYIIGKAR